MKIERKGEVRLELNLARIELQASFRCDCGAISDITGRDVKVFSCGYCDRTYEIQNILQVKAVSELETNEVVHRFHWRH